LDTGNCRVRALPWDSIVVCPAESTLAVVYTGGRGNYADIIEPGRKIDGPLATHSGSPGTQRAVDCLRAHGDPVTGTGAPGSSRHARSGVTDPEPYGHSGFADTYTRADEYAHADAAADEYADRNGSADGNPIADADTCTNRHTAAHGNPCARRLCRSAHRRPGSPAVR
jgi:hypothetical protein